MVNKEIVIQTIKKMHESGIEDAVIEATLRDIGLKDNEITEYIAEVKGKPEPKESELEQHEKIAEKAAEKIKQHLAEEREERELKDTAIHTAIEGHRAQLETMGEKLGELHEKVEHFAGQTPKVINSKLSTIEQRINSLEKQLSDLKSITTATKELMEKVLEANRKILTKL